MCFRENEFDRDKNKLSIESEMICFLKKDLVVQDEEKKNSI